MTPNEQGSIPGLLHNFESQWDRTITDLSQDVSAHFSVALPADFTPSNASFFLQQLTHDRLVKKASDCQFVILSSSPSTGKSAVGRFLRETGIPIVPRYTTRLRRPDEQDGIDYHFLDRETFEKMEREGKFAFTKPTYDEFRGIGRDDLLTALHSGKKFYVEGDALAYAQIAKQYPEFAGMKFLSVYLLPQAAKTLSNQLKNKAGIEFGQEELGLRLDAGIDYLRKCSDNIKHDVYDGFLVNIEPKNTASQIVNMISHPLQLK